MCFFLCFLLSLHPSLSLSIFHLFAHLFEREARSAYRKRMWDMTFLACRKGAARKTSERACRPCWATTWWCVQATLCTSCLHHSGYLHSRKRHASGAKSQALSLPMASPATLPEGRVVGASSKNMITELTNTQRSNMVVGFAPVCNYSPIRLA